MLDYDHKRYDMSKTTDFKILGGDKNEFRGKDLKDQKEL